MIVPTINQKIVEALKAHDEIRLSTLRMLSSSFNYERIKLQHDLTQDEELEVVRREAKKRKESIEIYEKNNRQELADKEKKELVILEEFLPAQISDQELEKLIDESIHRSGVSDIAGMGKVIALVKNKAGHTADGSRIAQLVKSKLAP